MGLGRLIVWHDWRLFHVERQRGQDVSEVCMDL
jgi:hypothetical protein